MWEKLLVVVLVQPIDTEVCLLETRLSGISSKNIFITNWNLLLTIFTRNTCNASCQFREKIHGYREDHGAVVLCCNVVQSLKIPQLSGINQSSNISNYWWCFTCRAAGHLTMFWAACIRALLLLCSPSAAITFTILIKLIHYISITLILILSYLCSGLPGSLSLCSHGSHQLFRNSDILHLNSLHCHTPEQSSISQ